MVARRGPLTVGLDEIGDTDCIRSVIKEGPTSPGTGAAGIRTQRSACGGTKPNARRFRAGVRSGFVGQVRCDHGGGPDFQRSMMIGVVEVLRRSPLVAEVRHQQVGPGKSQGVDRAIRAPSWRYVVVVVAGVVEVGEVKL